MDVINDEISAIDTITNTQYTNVTTTINNAVTGDIDADLADAVNINLEDLDDDCVEDEEEAPVAYIMSH